LTDPDEELVDDEDPDREGDAAAFVAAVCAARTDLLHPHMTSQTPLACPTPGIGGLLARGVQDSVVGVG